MTAYPPPGATVTEPSPRQIQVMIPLAKPRWSYVFLAINVAIWLIMTAYGYTQGLGLNGTESPLVLHRFGAQENLLIAQGEFWRLLTSNFIHIGILHLLFNSYALYILGQDVERLYGSLRFVAIYLLSGLGGSLAFYLLGDAVTSAGASGAIFGLIGTEIAFLWIHRDKFGRSRLLNLLIVAAFNLFIGARVEQINNIAHLGGLVTGVILGWLLAPDYKMPSQVIVSTENVVTLEDRNALQHKLVALTVVVTVLLAIGAAGTYRWNNMEAAGALEAERARTDLARAANLLESEDYAQAATLLRPLVTQQPDNGEAVFLLGLAEANMGNMDAAQQLWERTATLLPDFPGVHWNLALLHINQGRSAEAIAALEQFIGLSQPSERRDEAQALLEQLRQ